ncbi:hypothetical protein FNJ84_07455 [Paracoccus sp. M683]|uniref:hypothetical protein n=1 Tax=Paracoccus sp. M683 TaxID=2594268 RepID=UPI00119397A6|nr:hypothetical protein [Paracoccus sp. M683]TRW97347.1 hypothetical protein FNJ84_07455 [Paracoccus sp. M683]
MRLVGTCGISGAVLALAGTGAEACSAIARESSGVERGEQCSVSHFSPKGDVFSGIAKKISPEVVRQTINTGTGCGGEQIVVYYDCASKEGVWMGGEFNQMGMFDPHPPAPADQASYVPTMTPGPAAYFIDNEEGAFAPDYAPDALLAKAQSVGWMPQSGRVGTPFITVDGRRFNLACGCDLPQTGGN